VRNGDLRRLLDRIEIPGEHEARERAWQLVRAAVAEREPPRRARSRTRPLLALAFGLAVVAAALSPTGLAFLRSVRDTLVPERIERAQPALFSLPAPGRLLVVLAEGRGVFVVSADGSRRRLGRYAEAGWSPRGLFVVATRRHRLYALTPKGEERWSLARPSVSWPRWAPSGYRIAYVSGSQLRVVAGDGTGDALLADRIGGTPPAWRPGPAHVLAFVDRQLRITAVDVDTRRRLWRSRPAERPGVGQLAWSADGRRLLAVSPRSLRVFDARGRLLRHMPLRAGAIALAAQFAPAGHVFALGIRQDDARRSQVLLVNADRRMRPRPLFTGVGVFGDLAWSPDGRWLLVDWRSADQWLFIRARGTPKIVAVSNISAQLGVRSPMAELLDGWCCT
jgi:hypothetical protein